MTKYDEIYAEGYSEGITENKKEIDELKYEIKKLKKEKILIEETCHANWNDCLEESLGSDIWIKGETLAKDISYLTKIQEENEEHQKVIKSFEDAFDELKNAIEMSSIENFTQLTKHILKLKKENIEDDEDTEDEELSSEEHDQSLDEDLQDVYDDIFVCDKCNDKYCTDECHTLTNGEDLLGDFCDECWDEVKEEELTSIITEVQEENEKLKKELEDEKLEADMKNEKLTKENAVLLEKIGAGEGKKFYEVKSENNKLKNENKEQKQKLNIKDVVGGNLLKENMISKNVIIELKVEVARLRHRDLYGSEEEDETN